MKRILACIMVFVVPMALFLPVIAATKAEAASSIEEARQKILEEERKKLEERNRREEDARRVKADKYAEELRKAKELGFIALSESPLSRSAAKAFCQQQGGRLPRINNSDSWDGSNPPARGILIEGFGYDGRPWNELGLPTEHARSPIAEYWTGTDRTGLHDHSWVVRGDTRGGGKVSVNRHDYGGTYRVVCVPAHSTGEELIAAQERRNEEATRKAKEALKSAGFIAFSKSPMTWSDAKAFCQQQGGNLPRINGRDSWAFGNEGILHRQFSFIDR